MSVLMQLKGTNDVIMALYFGISRLKRIFCGDTRINYIHWGGERRYIKYG